MKEFFVQAFASFSKTACELGLVPLKSESFHGTCCLFTCGCHVLKGLVLVLSSCCTVMQLTVIRVYVHAALVVRIYCRVVASVMGYNIKGVALW